MSAVKAGGGGPGGGPGGEAVEDDLYDFSGLSINDFSLLQRGLMMATGGIQGLNGSNHVGSDDEEWYPPTPPPYDVADKLVEANTRLEADPNSTERIADKIKWRSESSLVEIRWMDEGTPPPNGVTKNGKEIIIVDDLTPHITAANNKSNGYLLNGFHPASSASSSYDEDEDRCDSCGQNGGVASSKAKEFPMAAAAAADVSSVDVSEEEEDDCAIVEEVGGACGADGRRVAAPAPPPPPPSSMRPNTAEMREEQQQQSSPSQTALSSLTKLAATPPAPARQTGSNQKVLPAAPTESFLPNGQQNRRKQQRLNSSSSSSDSANRGRAANAPKVQQSVVKAPDEGGEVWRSRSQSRNLAATAAAAAAPPAKLTRRANSGCNGLQSNGYHGVGVGGAKSRSQSVDHERVRVERIQEPTRPGPLLAATVTRQRRPTSVKAKLSSSYSLPDLKQSSVENSSSASSSAASPPFRPAGRSRPPGLPPPLPSHRTPLIMRPSATSSLVRKTSRNSLSSNSSDVSSQTTTDGDGGGTDSSSQPSSRREASDAAYLQWKKRKRQEKRLRDRRSFLTSITLPPNRRL